MTVVTSCSTQTNHASAPVNSEEVGSIDEMSREPFDSTRQCIDAWHILFSEWKENGGRIHTAIAETRAQITTDKKSRFAEMVRYVWKSQHLIESSKRRTFGEWPVSEEEEHDVARALMSSPRYGLPQDCLSTGWLAPMLWEEMLLMDGGTNRPKPVEAPASMIWDSPNAGGWAMYWLLRRTP